MTTTVTIAALPDLWEWAEHPAFRLIGSAVMCAIAHDAGYPVDDDDPTVFRTARLTEDGTFQWEVDLDAPILAPTLAITTHTDFVRAKPTLEAILPRDAWWARLPKGVIANVEDFTVTVTRIGDFRAVPVEMRPRLWTQLFGRILIARKTAHLHRTPAIPLRSVEVGVREGVDDKTGERGRCAFTDNPIPLLNPDDLRALVATHRPTTPSSTPVS